MDEQRPDGECHVKSCALLVTFLTVTTGAFVPSYGTATLDQPLVVINEIMYNAPDDLEELQYVELYNPGKSEVDLSGWKLTRAVKYAFPDRTTIKADGYVVVCKSTAEFKKHY